MNSGDAGLGGLYAFFVLLLFVIAVLWLVMPLLLLAINGNIKRLLAAHEETNRLLKQRDDATPK